MIDINGTKFFTSRELAEKVNVKKTYICRLAREGRLKHQKTTLGYLFPVDTAEDDWDNRFERITHG